MTDTTSKLPFPDRKISETFLDFAEPLLDAHGPRPSKAGMEQSIQLAFTVWNAVVYEDALGKSRFMESVEEAIRGTPEAAAIVNFLITRKRSLFGNDHRLVGEFKLFRKGGGWHLRAEARDPRPTHQANG